MERSSIQIQIFEDGHDKRPHDILPESASFPYLLGKKEGKKKFYYLSSCWVDAIREAVMWGEEGGGVLLFSKPNFFQSPTAKISQRIEHVLN